MESTIDLKQAIINNLSGLQDSYLKEIAEYVFFIRQKAINPESFQDHFAQVMLMDELALLNRQETVHLEDEFDNYQQQYPKE